MNKAITDKIYKTISFTHTKLQATEGELQATEGVVKLIDGLHIRSIIPADYEWHEYATRSDQGTGPWYLAHENERQLANDTLDLLWDEYCKLPVYEEDADEDENIGSGEEIENFLHWIEEEKSGYHVFKCAWGGIWHPNTMGVSE